MKKLIFSFCVLSFASSLTSMEVTNSLSENSTIAQLAQRIKTISSNAPIQEYNYLAKELMEQKLTVHKAIETLLNEKRKKAITAFKQEHNLSQTDWENIEEKINQAKKEWNPHEKIHSAITYQSCDQQEISENLKQIIERLYKKLKINRDLIVFKVPNHYPVQAMIPYRFGEYGDPGLTLNELALPSSTAELEGILQHEMTHFKFRDPIEKIVLQETNEPQELASHLYD